MGSYLATVNQIIADELASLPGLVLYGENIDKGSYISGLTRNLRVSGNGRIINVGDCEETHCGVGFGLMLNGVSSVLFAKQLDFVILGIDHFVNTYNFIRCSRHPATLGAFTIVTVVYDQGLQGPHSSFNALGDICSMARVPGYTITNVGDARSIASTQFARPGFRFVTLSQRLCSREIIDLDVLYPVEDAAVFQYADGEDLTIVCFNFSLPEGLELQRRAAERGKSASLFTVNQVYPADWTSIARSVARTGRLVVLDDSKSVNLLGSTVALETTKGLDARVALLHRTDVDFGVSPDAFEVDHDAALAGIGL